MPLPNDDDIIDEVASVLGMEQAEVDKLRLSIMETHEKAASLLERVNSIGHEFSVSHEGETFVSVAWLATLLLMESEQTMRGHGGCADHMRVVDWLETTIVAASKNLEE